jgi:NADH-quinone oxidoreductase subunit J
MLQILAQQDPMAAALFWLFALVTASSAIGVVASRNIVRMAVCLLFTLGGVAGLYFALAAEFLAAIQLIVYAGGTLILIIFGVMLTSKSPFSRLSAKPGEIAVAIAIGSVLLAALVMGIHAAGSSGDAANGAFAGQAVEAEQRYPMTRLGQVLLGDYLIPFEIVSVLLLVVMIGAAYLAKARRREP